jgi:hypothetical protein
MYLHLSTVTPDGVSEQLQDPAFLPWGKNLQCQSSRTLRVSLNVVGKKISVPLPSFLVVLPTA